MKLQKRGTLERTMRHEKENRCDDCGYASMPEGANFCPNCGARLMPTARKVEDDVGSRASVPTADAVPIHGGNDTYTTPSTNPAAVPMATLPPHDASTASMSGISEGPGNAPPSAMYFKKPTDSMLAQSKAGQRTSTGILFVQAGTDSFHGKFTAARNIFAGHVMSGDTIDLSLADFVHPVTKVRAVAVMGHVRVIVPRGVRVRTAGVGILGEFRGSRPGGRSAVGADQEAPLVVLEGSAILGKAEVRVNEKVPPVIVIS